MAALIGALRVSLSADTAAFQQGMKRAESQAKSSATAIQRSLGLVKAGFAGFVAGISLGAITQGIKASLDYAGSLGEVAEQLGVTARELQVFRFAVQQNGGTVEQADKALGKFQTAISKVLEGSKQAAAAFGDMGVKLEDLQTKSKSELIGQIADHLQRTGGAGAHAAAGVAVFGRDYQRLIPFLNKGGEAFNEAAAAAEEFGLILSDEHIQNADATADKIDKLMTALKVRIAADVSENSGAIEEFVSTLFDLVSALDSAGDALRNFINNYNLPNLLFKGDAFGLGVKGRSVTTDLNSGGTALAIARARGLKIAGTGSGTQADANRFLAGGGGSKRSKRAPRDTSLRDAFQFEEEQRRLDMDILRAKQDIAHDYVERTALSIEMLNLERQSFEAGLEYQVKAKELTQAQADAQRLKFAEVDRLKRIAVLEEEEEQRQRDYNMLEDKDFGLKLERLELEADLAETAKDRRVAELKILDLAHQEERNRLERIIRESQDWAEIEAARRELLELTQRQALERQGVTNRTRGPMESFQAEFGDIGEELENLKVQGIMGAADALTQLTQGWSSFKDAALSAIQAVLQELIRLQLMKLAANFLSASAGVPPGVGASASAIGSFGFASGGFTGNISRHKIAGFVHGQEGVLNTRGLATLGVPNLNALNRGAPLTAVAKNDNEMGGVNIGNITLPPGMSAREGRATGLAIGRGIQDRLGYTVTGRKR